MAVGTYTLKRGDNIWSLANGNYGAEYRNAIPGNTTSAKQDYLIKLNGIVNPRKMAVGTVVYLNEAAKSGASSSSSSSGSTSSVNTDRTVTFNGYGLATDSDSGRDVYACWSWTNTMYSPNTKAYKVRIEQFIRRPDGVGYLTWEVKENHPTRDVSFTADVNAEYVQIFVVPVAKTYKNDNEDVPYFTEGKEVAEIGVTYRFSDNPPKKPPKPTLKVEDLMANVTFEGLRKDIDASSIVLQVIRDNSTVIYTSSPIAVTQVEGADDYVTVSHSFSLHYGHDYRVRAKAIGANGKESGWSEFSDVGYTSPTAPEAITTYNSVKRSDDTIAAYLEWSWVQNATAYKIEYVTDDANYFESTSRISSVTTEDARTSYTIELGNVNETGKNYFFRVRAINDNISDSDNKTSEPSPVVQISIGSTPNKPPVWSTSDSAFAGDTTYKYVESIDRDGNPVIITHVDYTPMELNWIHNPTDSSKQTYAQLNLKIGDNDWFSQPITLSNTTDEKSTSEEIESFSYGTNTVYGTSVSYKGNLYFKLNTNHPDLANKKIQWKVRTSGITGRFSDEGWSDPETIYIYEKPTLGLSMTSDVNGTGPIIETLTSFPFYIRGTDSLKDYKIQNPVGYHLQIFSNEYYVTVDDIGRVKTINPGDPVYSKYFDTSDTLIVEMSANNLDLESGITYTVRCNMDMSTGLSVNNQHEFKVSWTDTEYAINANIAINPETYTALITPYCREKILVPGGKNLIPYPYANKIIVKYSDGNTVFSTNESGITTIAGVTFTDNGDGTIIVNGIAEETIIFYLQYSDFFNVIAGETYTLTGCPTGGGSTKWRLSIRDENLNGQYILINDAGNGATFIPKTSKALGYITISKGVECDNIIFKPMLELGPSTTEYEEYYEVYEDGNLKTDVTMSVYRREYDGSYKEIGSGIFNNVSITDPHPALDYARYRITAKDTKTGALSFWDMPGYPVNGSAVILQWDEEWSTFDTGSQTTTEGPAWTGSFLKLPYNIRVTDKRKREVSLVDYAGRTHSVSYYGTHIDESSQWNVEIPKNDVDTLYALRRLSLWSGDVYVREPSGMGYWANVSVSFNLAYNDVKVPITLDIKRVEGGV